MKKYYNNTILNIIWKNNRIGIIFIYSLNIIEEILLLLIPTSVGLMINTFLSKDGYIGLVYFIICYLGGQGVSTLRKINDTIIITKIQNELNLRIIESYNKTDIKITLINARVELVKQIVQFIEYDFPVIMKSFITIIGSAVILFKYNSKLLLVSLTIILPSLVLNYFYGKRIKYLSEKINNLYETQVSVLETRIFSNIKDYFDKLRKLSIYRSNQEAYNFAILEIFVFLMIVISVYIVCQTENMKIGDVVASYAIILRFAYGFDFIPFMTTKLASIKDILNRVII